MIAGTAHAWLVAGVACGIPRPTAGTPAACVRALQLATLPIALHIGAGVGAADAAVRYCVAPVVAIGQHPDSQAVARTKALDGWVAAVRESHGEKWTSWRLATPRALTCNREGAGYVCRALASPCTIGQNPERPPSPKPGLGI